MKISAQTNRVAVIDGHTEAVQVNLKNKAAKEDIIKVWKEFRSVPQDFKNFLLHRLIRSIILQKIKYPQPRLHRNIDKGMAVSIGRLRECTLFDFKFIILSHNTVRGAAGGAILCSELMKEQKYI